MHEENKHKLKKATVVERPLLSDPFENIAMDIVGLLQKIKESFGTY